MFFFGLFSTHLPYILVGVIYFATFAFASLQAMKTGVVEELHEENSHEIRVQTENRSLGDVYIFDDSPQVFSEPGKIAGLQKLPPPTVLVFFTGSEPPASLFHPGQLLVRPPPVLA